MDLAKLTMVSVLCALLMIPMEAWALCTADADCKDGRVCRDGICVLGGGGGGGYDDGGDLSAGTGGGTGWSLGAGIVGLLFSIAIASSASAAAIAADDRDEETAIPLAVTAAVLTGAMVPVVFAGGKSARRASQVRGVGAMRVLGWILYGVTMAGWIVTSYFPLIDEDVPGAYLAALGAGGALSELFMSIDAFVSYGQAKSASSLAGETAIGPALGAVRDRSGDRTTMTYGLAVQF